MRTQSADTGRHLGVRVTRLTFVNVNVVDTDFTLHDITVGASCRIVKLWLANRAAGGARVSIGLTVAAVFTAHLPSIFVPGNSLETLTEAEIPAREFAADIIIRTADNQPIEALAEVEEFRN